MINFGKDGYYYELVEIIYVEIRNNNRSCCIYDRKVCSLQSLLVLVQSAQGTRKHEKIHK